MEGPHTVFSKEDAQGSEGTVVLGSIQGDITLSEGYRQTFLIAPGSP